jgi:hypothetical protein
MSKNSTSNAVRYSREQHRSTPDASARALLLAMGQTTMMRLNSASDRKLGNACKDKRGLSLFLPSPPADVFVIKSSME